jgi:hypothetical protein
MTTITKNAMSQSRQFGNMPFGNSSRLPFRFETNSSGVALNTDLATAVQSGDVVVLGKLPAGFLLQDALVVISDAFTGSTTASIGFAYADGVDSTTVPQSATFFASALATSSTGVSRKTSVEAPVTLPKDANLILTIGGAAHASAGIMDIVIEGINTGG